MQNIADTPAYRIKVVVKNNLLLEAIEDAGFKTISSFCEAAEVNPSDVGRLLNLKTSPITSEGEFCLTAKKIMEFLGAAPSDLWSEEQLTMSLPKNYSWSYISSGALKSALGSNITKAIGANSDSDLMESNAEEGVFRKEIHAAIANILMDLTPKEQKVLKLIYGIDCDEHTREEVAKIFNLTNSRVWQIEQKALRKLRNPTRICEIAKTGYAPDLNQNFFNKILFSSRK